MTNWEFYSKRRNVNLVNLIIRNNIESYEQLVEFLKEKEVTAPEKGMFQSAYAIAVPPIPKTKTSPAPKKTAAKKIKTAVKKSSRKKKTTG
tara:strand:- start:28082 stop:28354 length:273 start_codon:yes stop_codon:yes gene_type:complete